VKDQAEGRPVSDGEAAAAAIRHLASLYPQVVADIPAYGANRFEPLGQGQLQQLQAYLDTLLTWRKRMSLVATAEPRKIAEGHLLDSLFAAPLIHPGELVADVGSGAGFPGIPLSIVQPEARFVLVESRRKRANFLREVVRVAALPNVEIGETRVEALAKLRPGEFDTAVARAVGSTTDLLRLVQPLLRTGGTAIAMKGPRTANDAAGSGTMRLRQRIEYCLPGSVPLTLLVYENQPR
jgi:16S rRNA (guanine527-N7)-methyltransferase